MNQAHRFEQADAGLAPALHSPSKGHFAARARQQRADAAAAMIAPFRGMTGALRLVLARRSLETTARHRDALMRCSDRVLAGIGIERRTSRWSRRGSIPPSVSYGTAGSGVGGPQRMPAWSAWEERREQRRIYRELDAYTDRELDEIAARRHPCHRARAPGPAPGGVRRAAAGNALAAITDPFACPD